MQEFFVLFIFVILHDLQQSIQTHSLRPVPLFDAEVPGEKADCLSA